MQLWSSGKVLLDVDPEGAWHGTPCGTADFFTRPQSSVMFVKDIHLWIHLKSYSQTDYEILLSDRLFRSVPIYPFQTVSAQFSLTNMIFILVCCLIPIFLAAYLFKFLQFDVSFEVIPHKLQHYFNKLQHFNEIP